MSKIIDFTDEWHIEEGCFSEGHLGKFETIMAQGNGYMGLRGATEEPYMKEVRDCFIAGTFNIGAENEVTELPNIPDFLNMRWQIDGEDLNLSILKPTEYRRSMNLRNGETIRSFVYTTKASGRVAFIFRRFASMANRHNFYQMVEVKPLDKKVTISVRSGIDGRVTNTGSQHFIEGDKRFYDGQILEMVSTTRESRIDLVQMTSHKGVIGSETFIPKGIIMDRRQIYIDFSMEIPVATTFKLMKYTTLTTTRDQEFDGFELKDLRLKTYELAKIQSVEEYDEALQASTSIWNQKLWDLENIRIESEDGWDQVAANFARYHLQIMTPMHDQRMGIGAKGMTGEGYKGHSFWDTEIFIYPYFLYTQPEVAKNLLTYRYLTLDGARQKAKDNGYEGAMFPWESAWLEDGEVTPVWGAADIVTGKQTKIWSGFIEQHITSDIIYALWQYEQMTCDHEFMEAYGYEMLFETAKFWTTRLEYDKEDGCYHINNVVGPDEYKEHVDDNAFTNYMAAFNIGWAIDAYEGLRNQSPSLLKSYEDRFALNVWIEEWRMALSKIYLPTLTEEGILPQDRTYLTLENFDLIPYKEREQVGTLFRDYNLEQVNQIQISKQADVLMLFYLREHLFDHETKLRNFHYYEARTTHDSSLSLSTHAILANDLGERALAQSLYKRCRDIDLGPNMKSSDHGIHAASLGGLMQAIINGFGGLRLVGEKLRIEPSLPSDWKRLTYKIFYKSHQLEVVVDHEGFEVTNRNPEKGPVEFISGGCQYLLIEKTRVMYKEYFADNCMI